MVLVVFEYIEVDRTIAFISISGIQDLVHEVYLLDDVSRCTRLDRRRSYVKHAHGLMIGKCTSLNHLHRLQLLKACLLCDLVFSFVCVMLKMAYVSDVTDIAYLVAEMLQQFHEYIISHSWSCVSKMSVAVDCRTADVKSDVSLIDRLEYLFLP